MMSFCRVFLFLIICSSLLSVFPAYAGEQGGNSHIFYSVPNFPVLDSPDHIDNTQADGYPRVALVLSGGGALGMAHIGMIRKLEELGIPIDMVLGTSMGAIVGALYASGYSPADLERVVRDTRISNIISFRESYMSYYLGPVLAQQNNIISFNFDKNSIGKSLGIIPDSGIVLYLSELLFKVSHIRDFNKLPIPFTCIGTDLFTGVEVAFSSGVLAEVVRGSMSVPGVFTPYPLGGTYIIDGGVVNNLPVKLARDLGADIVIAVNVNSPFVTSIDKYTSALDVIIQYTNIVLKNIEESQESMANIVVYPDLTGMDQTQLSRGVEFLERGNEAARKAESELKLFAEYIAEYRPLVVKDPDRAGDYFSIPDPKITAIAPGKLPAEGTNPLPLELFSSLNGKKMDSVHVNQLSLRLNQLLSSGKYESVSFYLEAIPMVEKSDRYLMRIDPVYSNRGKHSLGIGFEFDGGYSGSYKKDSWYVHPAFVGNLLFSDVLGSSSYLSLDLNLSNTLQFDARLSIPLTEKLFIAQHMRGGNIGFTGLEDIDTYFSNFSFIASQEIGYRITDYLVFGMDLSIEADWIDAQNSGGSIFAAEFVPLITPTVQWQSADDSKFLYEGIISTLELDLPLFSSNSWYYRYKLEHKQAVPLSLQDSILYRISIGNYRGEIEMPKNYFDRGGWNGIPGYLPGQKIDSSICSAGMELYHRFDALSELMDMDFYAAVSFGAANTLDAFQTLELSDFDFGGAFGIGFRSIIGELLIGFGLNSSLNSAVYVILD